MKTKYQYNRERGMWRSAKDPTLPIETSITRIAFDKILDLRHFELLYSLGWIGDEFKRLMRNGTINPEDYEIVLAIRKKDKTL